MPTRRPRALIANDPRVIESFTWACNDDYTETYFGKGVFATTAEARRAWPQYRRTIWARTHRMSLPRPAQVFDALTRHGWKTIWFSRNQTQFPTEEALVALEADRAAVVAFEQRDPTGAATIADYLGEWRADLDTLERVARTLDGAPFNQRGSGQLTTAQRYGASPVD